MRMSPVRVVTLLPRELQGVASEALAPLPAAIEHFHAPPLAIARIESGVPDLVIADADLAPRVGDLCLLVRSLRPDGLVLPVLYFWSEREAALRTCAGGVVLHKPARLGEWRREIERALDLNAVARLTVV